jgi:O-antigen/teichoic acid export membrane protein
MFNLIKKAVKNTAIYSIGHLSSKLIGFVLLPLYTSHLSVAEYGILSILDITVQVLTTVFGISLYRALSRWYWDKEYRHLQKSIVYTSLLFLTVLSGIMLAGFFTVSRHISVLLFSDERYLYLIRLMLFSSVLKILEQVPLTVLRLQEKPVLFSISNLTKLSVSLVLTILFITKLKRNVAGIYEAQLIGELVMFLMLSPFMVKNMAAKIEWRVLKDMLSFSLPLAFAGLAGILFTFADRYSLKFLTSLDEVGVYSLGYRIANVIKVIMASVQFALTPMVYKMMDQPDSKRFYSKILTYITFLLTIMALGLSLFGKEIVYLLARDPAFYPAFNIIPLIAVALVFEALVNTAAVGLNISKNTKITAIILTLISLLNISLNLLLIPSLKSFGAALATVLSQVLYFILILYYAQKTYRIPYEYKKVTLLIISAIVVFILSFALQNLSFLLSVFLKIFLLFSFPVLLKYLNFYEPIELERIRELRRKFLKF